MSASVNWRDDAACARADPDLFFPVSATGLALSQIDEAKRVCQGCPARTPCLEWALEHAVAAGIWGGATDEERRAMRQRLIHRQHTKGDPPCASERTR
jgi:WhiB family redox-sensing transcriptional regulator